MAEQPDRSKLPLPEPSFAGSAGRTIGDSTPIHNRSYTLTADLVIPDGGADGVIVANADAMGGYSLFALDGKLRHTYSFMGALIFQQVADTPLPTGTIEKVTFDIRHPNDPAAHAALHQAQHAGQQARHTES